MATMFFKGRIDFDLLTMSEISEITAALSVLEKLGEKEGFAFESGRSRRSVPRPDAQGARSMRRPLTQRRVLACLLVKGPLAFDQLLEACGLKPGSITPNLSALYKEGLLVKSRDSSTDGSRDARRDTLYSLNEKGRAVATQVAEDGDSLL